MPANALFDLLPDFGARTVRAEAPTRPQRPSPDPTPQVDTDALIAEAVARTEAEVTARLAAAHRAELEAERAAHAEEARTFLSTLGDDVGKTIAAQLESAQSRIIDLVGSQVARILGAMLADDLQQRSLAALARTVRDTLGDAETMRVRVSGPLSLYETLREALGPRGQNLDFVEAPGFDLTVTLDDAVFETRMSEWSQALSEILS
jgi:hypothetical protein